MNLAVSTGAASAFAAGGGFAWAIAPDTIKALTAAEIMSFLSIVASSKGQSADAEELPRLVHQQLPRAPPVPAVELARWPATRCYVCFFNSLACRHAMQRRPDLQSAQLW